MCNWKHWTQEKPKELYSEIGSASHGICFTNPETNELWLCKSIGWLVGNEEEILQYVKENVNKLSYLKTILKTFKETISGNFFE